jgi:hypothetical protein
MSNKQLKDARKENQQSANEKVNQVVKDVGLSKDQRRQLHDQITGNDYMTYQDIKKIAEQIKESSE